MKRILVVDDDIRVCEALRDFLAADGYDVPLAHDGQSALDRLGAGGIDLLILDINMPGLGGASLIQMLRTDPAWQRFARLPVIVVSALWDVVSFDLDIQGGFGKPMPFDQIQAKVRELIGPPG